MESDFIRKVGTDSKKVFYHQQHLSGGFFWLNFGFFKEFCSFQKLEKGCKTLSSSLPVTMLNRARVVRVHFLHKPSKAERRPNLVNHHK